MHLIKTIKGDITKVTDVQAIVNAAIYEEKVMLEKRIVYKVPSEVRKQSIETLKVRKTTLEYLRQNGFKTVEDIIDKQLEIPSEYRGNIYAYLMFGIED